MKILYNTGSEFKESKESTDKMMVKVAEDNGNIVEKSVQELVSNSFYDIKRLIGTEDTSDANSSVRAIARNELAKQLVPENASDALDTLQEIADWIQDHPDDASQMNSRIDALEEAVPFVLYIKNGVYGYKNANNEFVPFKSQADIDAAVSAAMVGTATAADVLSGKTFTNSSNSGVSGSMPARTNGTSATGSGIDGTGPWVYMPYGYYPEYSGNAGNSYIYMTAAQAVNACPKQEKTVTAGTSAASVTPDSGKLLSKVTYNPTPSQEKTVTAGTSASSVTPDSGKLLSKVTYNPTPSQSKSTTSSRSAQTITPDSGKLLSSVSIAKYPDASGNYTCGSNNGAASSNDMGATNNYRYVNATAVYDKGKADALYNCGTFVNQHDGSQTLAAKIIAVLGYTSSTQTKSGTFYVFCVDMGTSSKITPLKNVSGKVSIAQIQNAAMTYPDNVYMQPSTSAHAFHLYCTIYKVDITNATSGQIMENINNRHCGIFAKI